MRVTPDAADSGPVFDVQGLHKSYGAKTVLRGLDFRLERTRSLVVLGRSGTGKSVLLRQLNGLERPDSGRVIFNGTDLTTLTERQLYPVRRRLAMLFQGGALFDSMSVGDNVAFPMRKHTDWSDDEVTAAVADKLRRVGLTGIEDKMPSDLSGGMKKRVALARSLALDPEVVLFDEPTTGLDPVTSASIAELIRGSQRQLGATAVVVTHDLPLARRVGDRVAFLEDGRFRFLGTWEEADASPDRVLSDFLAGRGEELSVA